MDQTSPRRDPGELFQAAARAFGTQDWAQAESICRRVLAAEPQHADALHMLGLICTMRRRTDEAIDYLRQATTAQPGNALQWTNFGKIYREAGRFGEAVDCERRAIALHEGLPEAHFNLGLAYRG